MFRFFNSLRSIFTPPFDGLGLCVVLYYAWAHLVYPHNDVLRGNLPDPDDYMYLTQILDWIKGQNWYDNIQHRLNPPEGTPIHFSRFAQMPIAAGILLLHWLGLPLRGAATLTALIEPLILLSLCLLFLRKLCSKVVPASWAGASAYAALFSVGLLYEFMPGHVDHHGLVIVLLLAAIEPLLELMDEPSKVKAATKAGVILAIALMIALECLPWVLLLSAWLGLWSLAKGGEAAKSTASFGLSFLTTTLICLAVTRPPVSWLELDILTYSAVYVLLALAMCIPFLGSLLVRNLAPSARWPLGLALAATCTGCFLHYFPELIFGPYGGIDPQLYPILLDEVEEAKPIFKTTNGISHIINFMTIEFIALVAGLYFAFHAKSSQKLKWSLLTLLLTASMGLTIFYQYRFLGEAAVFAIPPLTAFLCYGWRALGERFQNRPKFFAEIGLLLLIGPLPSVILPALFDSRSFNTGMILFPVDSGHSRCDMANLEGILRDPKGFGSHSRLIVSYMAQGPEILFRTDHQVLAAPFHMNITGNLDASRFFTTPYQEEAKHIAERRSVDLIVACRNVPSSYLAKEGALPSFIEQIFTGKAPAWLIRQSEPSLSNYVIYETRLGERLLPQGEPISKKMQ